MFAKLFGELKRRNVIRVAGVYAVAAWTMFQVASAVFQTFDLPKWCAQLTLVLLLFGLPITLIIAWAYERGAGGRLVPTADAPESAPAARLATKDYILLGGLLLVVAASAIQVGALVLNRSGAPEKSVAVLPFVAFTPQAEVGYFADGLTEEVINSLAQAPDLKVAGRTSAFYFKGKNQDLRQVGMQLGVAHVVEGSVRRDGDRMRVTAQLIKVSDGFHLWSKSYDRPVSDAFAVQTEIGAAVSEALQTSLKTRPGKSPARDPAAYPLQLTARAQLLRQDLESLQAARLGYEKLMALEPQNADAYAGYAQATMTLAQNFLSVDFETARKISQAAIDRAVALDPRSEDVWLARVAVSRVLFIRIGGARYERDFDQAAHRAVEIAPRNPEALTFLALRQSEAGQPTEAVATARKALELDPLNRLSLTILGKALTRVGRLDEAEAQHRAVAQLYPDFAEGRYQLAKLLMEKGRLDLAEPEMRALSASGENAFISIEAAMMYMNLDLPDEASRVLSLIKGSPGRELGQTQIYAARGDWAGMLTFGKAMQAKSNEPFWPTVVFQGEAMTGHPVEALRALRGLRPDLFTAQPSVAVTDLGTPLAAAHLMRATGATAQGDLLLARIMAVTAPIADLRSPNDWRVARLRVFAERGQTAEGLAELEGLVRAGWRSPYLFDDSTPIEQSPTIGRLKDEPRFKALLAEVRQDLAQQRAAVLAARQKGAG